MYLLTYSRADLEKVPTRDVFDEMVSLAGMEMAGVKVIQWVVSLRSSQGGPSGRRLPPVSVA